MPSRHEFPALADLPNVTAEADDERLEAYTYPEAWARIAVQPEPVRDAARLLTYDRQTGRIEHRRFRDLPDCCSPGDVVVINESRVIPARLVGTKASSGGRVEVLLVRREDPGVWTALVKGTVRVGQRIAFEADVEGEVLESSPSGRVRLRLTPDDGAWIERAGRVPLPPYIAKLRGVDASDHEDRARYQTVYARVEGSVAAPTAGLHFTDAVLEALADRGVRVARVTLHVGPGTFEPLRAARVADHRMDAEWGELSPESADAINHARECGGRVIAVGTTTTRLIESAAVDGRVRAFAGETSLFIRPGYRWRAVNALVTNFHLPRSTPLLLASALCGRSVLFDLYREAAAEGYRFYSYGDAMVIL